MQKRLRETFIDFRAQARDVHVDHIGLRVEMVVPHVLQQHGAGDYLPRVLHQVFQQAEFARLQRNLSCAAADLMRQPVEFEIADAQHGFLATRPAPSRQHFDARQQLGERIGLGQVIVAAGAQALDPIVDLAERRQNERRRLDALVAQRADQREPVALGQHAVDDEHVILAVERHRQTVIAVIGGVGDMTDLTERLDQIVGGVAVVLDDQKAHGDPIRLRIGHPAEGASPLNIRISGHRLHQIQSNRQPVNSQGKDMPHFVREGVADLARHPLNDPTPAGATIARVRVQTGSRRTIRFAGFPELGRDGHKARPVEVYRQRGRRLPAIRPELFTQLLPTGRATKRVLSPFFTRTSTLRLPSVRALATPSRTSAGDETDLPATSRITSPVEKPRSAATPEESTPVTTTPSLPAPATRAAGASVRPSLPISLLPLSAGALASARASLAAGISPSVKVSVFSEPLCRTASLTEAFGGMAPIFLARSRASLTGLPSTAVMTSPASMPAFLAGLSACGSATSAPSAFLRPRLSAMSCVTG